MTIELEPKECRKAKEEIVAEGIDAMVRSFMVVIEKCVRQRCEQIMKVVEKGINED